jgi:4-amino-4-deoxy-L-arabinose transferase-like glycosyltransferase
MRLAAVVALGLLVRLGYVVTIHVHVFPDSHWYIQQAENLRAGVGYIDPARQYAAFNGHPEAAGSFHTAYWPPLYTIFLAGVQSTFGTAFRTAQLAGVAIGAATILLTGLLGRAVAGTKVGLVGALLVALSPFLIAVDGSVMSETLYVPLVLATLLLAQRARTKPSASSWCLLGAAIGSATLARQDALAMIVFVFIPAAVLARAPAHELVPRVALGFLALLVVLAPWVIRNAIEMGEPTISTVSSSGVIAGSNCSDTYSGKAIGYWSYGCMHPELGLQMSETTFAAKIREQGVTFAIDHARDWPQVAAARATRVWGLWDPRDQSRREGFESRNRRWQLLAWVASLATLLLAIGGFRVLATQKRPIAVLVGPVFMTTTIALASYGNTRFRAATEPVLAIAAAAAILATVSRISLRNTRPFLPA